jgi:hypothetical protein
MKRSIIALIVSIVLALLAAGVFTAVDGYTKSAKTKLELQKTYQELQLKQIELDKNKLDSQENQKKIDELTKQLQAKRNAATAVAQSVKPVQARVTVSNPQCEAWMVEAGIPITNASKQLILKESGCRFNAVNPDSGACGIPQAYPCSKLPCTLDANGAVCQLRWMQGYVVNRYTTWENALAKWFSRCGSPQGCWY